MDWLFIAFAGAATLLMLALTGHERQRRLAGSVRAKTASEMPSMQTSRTSEH
jgi:hypothetical protein